MQLSLTAVRYGVWALCEVGDEHCINKEIAVKFNVFLFVQYCAEYLINGDLCFAEQTGDCDLI